MIHTGKGIAACFTAAATVLGIGAQAQQSEPFRFPVVDPATMKTYEQGLSDGDYVLAPPYTNAPELATRQDVAHGKIYHFVMNSTDSKIYPGIAKSNPGAVVPYTRRVTVYVPDQYKAGKPAPFLITQDSMAGGILPTILDNMIADKRLPALVAIFMDSGGGDAQGSQRGLEYDAMSGKFAEYVETEVLPRASKESGVTFSHNPDARMTMGGSSGGACALSMAWYHPEWWHRVLSYSGTFVDQESPFNPLAPHGAWEYHEHFIANQKQKPLRIWIEVGDNDNRSHDPEETLHNWVMANQRTAAVLKARKYHYQFVFARNAGHVDGRVVGQTLPAALEWVWRGYRDK